MNTQKMERPTPEEAGQRAAENSTGKVTTDNLQAKAGECQEVGIQIEENSICVDYGDADVEIINEAYDNGRLSVYDTFYVSIVPTKGTTLALTLNRDQIQALKDILDNYLEAFEVNRKLMKPCQIKARKKEVTETA